LRARARAVGLATFYVDTAALAELESEERGERLRTWDTDAGASAAR
jgi:hypothetical protein